MGRNTFRCRLSSITSTGGQWSHQETIPVKIVDEIQHRKITAVDNNSQSAQYHWFHFGGLLFLPRSIPTKISRNT
jgi:hypothetical protein